MCKVGALAAEKKYNDAASLLSSEALNLAPQFQQDALKRKVEILRTWANGRVATIEDYKEFYLGDAGYMFSEQTRPAMTLYESEDIADKDKYPVLAALFERKADWEGQSLALLIAADLSDSGKEPACGYLVGAGYGFYQLGEVSRAERAWLDAAKCPHNDPSWPKAASNLGILERDRKNYRKAIDYFQAVIESHPDDKEPGGSLMETYRNYSHSSAMALSECYEKMGDFRSALDYVQLAKSRYPYYSWCGTCLASESRRINARIAYLSVARYRSAELVVLLLLLGTGYRLRSRHIRKARAARSPVLKTV